MTNLKRAITWAVAMLFIAAGKRMGFMDEEAADTLLLVLPIIAVTTMLGRNSCGREFPA